LGGPSGERQHGQQIIALEIFIVGQNLVDHHAGAE
jgi:hypothetical protein